MAKTKPPLIPHKLFRHFAVTTLVITAAIALLAQDHNREILESQVAQQAPQLQAPSREAAPQPLAPTLTRSTELSADVGKFENLDSGFGKPMVRTAAITRHKAGPARATSTGERPDIPGYSQDYLNNLSEEEYLALVEGLREAGMLDQSQRRAQITALDRASRARSGTATPVY